MKRFSFLALILSLLAVVAACGEAGGPNDVQDSVGGVRTVTPNLGATILANPPANLVVLDVRTPEEFDQAHLEGATLVNFYDNDFADQLSALDRDVPYLVYCRSGNRSGQAIIAMSDLGFGDVSNVDGGIVRWMEAGLPVVQP